MKIIDLLMSIAIGKLAIWYFLEHSENSNIEYNFKVFTIKKLPNGNDQTNEISITFWLIIKLIY